MKGLAALDFVAIQTDLTCRNKRPLQQLESWIGPFMRKRASLSKHRQSQRAPRPVDEHGTGP
jgi:hypothetical protein